MTQRNSASSRPPAGEPHLLPPEEPQRMAAVRRYDILDTPPDGSFDRIAELAARILDTPIATVTIVDHDRIWFKAHHGIEVDEIDRLPGLCASAILRDDPYIVNDAAVDPRTLTNPLVCGELGLRFYAAAPLITSDGYRLGTVNVIDQHPRAISVGDVRTLQDLAALVVDELELRLAARRAVTAKLQVERLGDALQRSILPPTLPSIPGLEMAAYYGPAREGLEVGGDFYDVFEAGDGTWGAAIGDVCGRGVEAAVLMSAVRHRFRALAQTGGSPARVLEGLNDSLVGEDLDGGFCTLCYLHLRPETAGVRVTVCSGGHPLPMVRRANGEVETVGASGMLLGPFAGVRLEDVSTMLGPGDLLMAYTDGLVDQRSIDLCAGEEALRSVFAAAGAAGGHEIASVLEGIEQHMPRPPGGREDDTAMLLLRVSPRP